jgi:hypothetical protein
VSVETAETLSSMKFGSGVEVIGRAREGDIPAGRVESKFAEHVADSEYGVRDDLSSDCRISGMRVSGHVNVTAT